MNIYKMGFFRNILFGVFVVCFLLFVVYCLLFIVCCLLFACCMLYVVCCLLYVACCMLYVVCCMLHVAYCMFIQLSRFQLQLIDILSFPSLPPLSVGVCVCTRMRHSSPSHSRVLMMYSVQVQGFEPVIRSFANDSILRARVQSRSQ